MRKHTGSFNLLATCYGPSSCIYPYVAQRILQMLNSAHCPFKHIFFAGNFFDTMELHTKVIIVLVLIAALVIIPIIVALFRKWKKERGTGNRKKTFCAWFFKCEPNGAQEHLVNNDIMLNEMQDMNGGAISGRLLY